MPSMTIKKIPRDLSAKLKKKAMENGPSPNGEVIVCLQRAVEVRPLDPETFPAAAESRQRRMAHPPITDEILRAAREGGRA